MYFTFNEVISTRMNTVYMPQVSGGILIGRSIHVSDGCVKLRVLTSHSFYCIFNCTFQWGVSIVNVKRR
jgi:hypothetical protein